MTSSHQNNATDPVNAALNYGYGFLEAECRRAINAVGLEPSVGFLHETSGYQTKQSLVYDLQEPFRWIADVTVMEAFESRALDLPDFYFTGDDYRYRFDSEPKQRFLGLLRGRFNSSVKYRGRVMRWDAVIRQKTDELARYLGERSRSCDFTEPRPFLERADNQAVREAILELTHAEAKELDLGKSTLHYLRQKAHNKKAFKIYRKTLERLQNLGSQN
jgi:CRISPR-associated protein Cas1